VLLVIAGVLASCGGGGTPNATGPAASPAVRSGTPPSSAPASSSPTLTEEPAVDVRPMRFAAPDTYAWRIAVAPDGQTALLGQSSGFFPSTRESRIVQVALEADGSWGEGQPVSFSTDASADLDPFFAADGSRVWFSSIRPVDGAARTDTDLWYVDVDPDGGYGEPVNAGPEVNSPGEDLYPTIGPEGTLYFGSDRGGGGFDIWRVAPTADGGWATPEPLPAPVNTSAWEFNPAIAPDGRTLVFTALSRTGGPGAGDLWFSTRDGDGWSEPALLGVVNTTADEYHASFSPDGATLYFVRGGVLHEIPTDATGLPSGG
jgi:hypothetical protein